MLKRILQAIRKNNKKRSSRPLDNEGTPIKYEHLVKKARFTYNSKYPEVTIAFLKENATHTVRRFIRALMLKIFKIEELEGRQATARKPNQKKDGTRAPAKQPIDQERKDFIEGKFRL